MAGITWSKALSVGVPALDDDHRGLMEVINRLDRAEDAPAMRESMDSLKRYARHHFAREEAVMRRCGFAGLARHITEHEKFIGRIRCFDAEIDAADERSLPPLRRRLLGFLRTWWKHHILEEDMAYSRAAQADPVEARRAAAEVKGSDVWWN